MSDANPPARIKSHRDLIAWQKAMVLVTDVYGLTRAFPREEVYGLTSQIRRAAASYRRTLLRVKGAVMAESFTSFWAMLEFEWTDAPNQF
jgi:hypothetical protein